MKAAVALSGSVSWVGLCYQESSVDVLLRKIKSGATPMKLEEQGVLSTVGTYIYLLFIVLQEKSGQRPPHWDRSDPSWLCPASTLLPIWCCAPHHRVRRGAGRGTQPALSLAGSI